MTSPAHTVLWGADAGGLALAPLAPWWALAALGALALAAVAFAMRGTGARRRRMACWAFAAFVAALALAQPVRSVPATPTDEPPAPLPVVRVLVDRSDSMSLGEPPTLAALAEGWLRAFADASEGRVRVTHQSFAERLGVARAPHESAPDEPVGAGATLLVDAAEHAIESMSRAPARPAHLILLSDGRDTSGRRLETIAAAARAAGVRVHVPALEALGRLDDEFPLRLAAHLSPGTITAGERVTIDAVASLSASERDHAEALTWLVTGVGEDGREAELLRVPSRLERSAGRSWAQARHEVRPPSWSRELVIEARAGEHAAYAVCPVRVLDAPLEALVVTGAPSLDVTFAVRAWRRSPGLRLTVLALRDPATGCPAGVRDAYAGESAQALDAETMLTPHALAGYELIVLAPGVRSALTGEAVLPPGLREALLDAAARAPGLIEFDAVASADTRPVQWSWTNTGEALLALLHGWDRPPAPLRLPAPDAPLSIDAPLILAEAETPSADVPVITARMSRGRRALGVHAQGLWRAWRDEDPADEPWTRLARFAATGDPAPPERAIALSIEPATTTPGADVRVRVQGLGEHGGVLIYDPPGAPARAIPLLSVAGEWEATVRVEAVGRHRFSVRDEGREASALAIASPVSMETLEPEPRAEAMRRLALQTGGRVFSLTEPPEPFVLALLEDTLGSGVAQRPIIDPRLAIAAIGTAFLLAWLPAMREETDREGDA